MKTYSVSVSLITGSKNDFEKSYIVSAINAEDALDKIKEKNGDSADYEVDEVDLEKLKRGESILVYAKYNR